MPRWALGPVDPKRPEAGRRPFTRPLIHEEYMRKSYLLLLCVALTMGAPRVVSAQVHTQATEAGQCNQVCGRLWDQWGNVIGYYCNTTTSVFGGGHDCLATPSGCSVSKIGCDIRQAMNSIGEPVWLGRNCDPVKGETRMVQAVSPDTRAKLVPDPLVT